MATEITKEQLQKITESTINDCIEKAITQITEKYTKELDEKLHKEFDELSKTLLWKFQWEVFNRRAEMMVSVFARIQELYHTMSSEIVIRIPFSNK